MKQIFNWTIGSFFRSFGRILCYLVVGGLIAILLYQQESVRDFRITDLFGIQRVSAAEVSVPVIPFPGEYFFNAQAWSNFNVTSDQTMAYKTITSSNDMITNYIQFQTDSIASQNYDYIEFTYSFSDPLIVTTTTSVPGQDYCERWTWGALDSYNNVIRWDCARVNQTDSYNLTNIYDEEIDQFNFSFEVEYTNGGHNTCTTNGNKVLCPVYKNQISKLYIYTNFKTKRSTTFDLYISRRVAAYTINNVAQAVDTNTNAINSQTQQQQQQHQELMDSNTTSDVSSASNYFNDFNETAQDGIKAIVSMPLNIFNALTLGSTKDLCFNLKGKQSCFPSGAMLWNKSSRTTIHAGNATLTPHPFSNGGGLSEQLNLFKGLFNIVVGGYLAYKMLKSLMRITNDMLSPTHDKIEVLDL